MSPLTPIPSTPVPAPVRPRLHKRILSVLLSLAIASGSAHVAAEDKDTLEFLSKAAKASEWTYSLASTATIGLAGSVLGTLLNKIIGGTPTVNLSQESLDKIKGIVDNALDTERLKTNSNILEGHKNYLLGFTRNPDPRQWGQNYNNMKVKISELLTNIYELERSGGVGGTPQFVEAATLYLHASMAGLYLYGASTTQGNLTTEIDAYRPIFAKIKELLEKRRNLIDEIANRDVDIRPGYIDWRYRKSKAQYRGYFHWQVVSPTNEALFVSDIEDDTNLSSSRPQLSGDKYWRVSREYLADSQDPNNPWPGQYSWGIIHWNDTDSMNDALNNLGRCRDKYREYMLYSTINALITKFDNLSTIRGAVTNYLNMTPFNALWEWPKVSRKPAIVVPAGYNSWTVWGNYQYYQYDIIHSAFMFSIKPNPIDATGNLPWMTLEHNSSIGYREMATISLNDIIATNFSPTNPHQWAIFGTSDAPFKGQNQELRIWSHGNYPKTSITFNSAVVVGFTYTGNRAAPAVTSVNN